MNLLKNLEKRLIKRNNYDFVVGSSDPWFGILGRIYAKKFKIRYIYDMQDHYHDYFTYKIPFLKYLDKEAVKDADIVLTVSDSLNGYVKKFRKKPTFTIQNGIELSQFKKIDRKIARKVLKLPPGKIIIYVGEISKFKGVHMLVDAFIEVKTVIPDAYLLLSGKILDNIDIKQDAIIYEKYPKRKEVLFALKAADVAVLPNVRNVLTEYGFPYKLLEYMAAGLPVVATKLGDASTILSRYDNLLCNPDDKYDLAEKLIYALKHGKKINYHEILKNLTWESLSKKLDTIIRKVSKKK